MRKVTDDPAVPPDGVITADDILRLVRRQPFVPFRIHMSDGTSYEVRHPELVWVLARRLCIAVPSQRDGVIQDIHYCAMLHITRLEELAHAG
jgi:hypothetical protein